MIATRPLTPLCAALLVIALATSVVGCSSAEKPGAKTGSESDTQGTVVNERRVNIMDVKTKRSKIGTGFPVEVPVAAGEVVRGEAQSASAWNYELVVDASIPAVAQWYRGAYVNRGWTQLKNTDPGSADKDMSFSKQTAQSRIVLSADGDKTRVVGVLGLGTPVLQTQ